MQPYSILAGAAAALNLPPDATASDQAFAWGAVFLLVALILWRTRSA